MVNTGKIYFQKSNLDSIDQQFVEEMAKRNFFLIGILLEQGNQKEVDNICKQLQIPDQPRFRSKFVIEHNNRKYFIYRARQGGGNRGDYEDPQEQEGYYQKYNKSVYNHPSFLADIDEEGDTTYNMLIFSLKELKN